jgi:hypothetical protein
MVGWWGRNPATRDRILPLLASFAMEEADINPVHPFTRSPVHPLTRLPAYPPTPTSP